MLDRALYAVLKMRHVCPLVSKRECPIGGPGLQKRHREPISLSWAEHKAEDVMDRTVKAKFDDYGTNLQTEIILPCGPASTMCALLNSECCGVVVCDVQSQKSPGAYILRRCGNKMVVGKQNPGSDSVGQIGSKTRRKLRHCSRFGDGPENTGNLSQLANSLRLVKSVWMVMKESLLQD